MKQTHNFLAKEKNSSFLERRLVCLDNPESDEKRKNREASRLAFGEFFNSERIRNFDATNNLISKTRKTFGDIFSLSRLRADAKTTPEDKEKAKKLIQQRKAIKDNPNLDDLKKARREEARRSDLKMHKFTLRGVINLPEYLEELRNERKNYEEEADMNIQTSKEEVNEISENKSQLEGEITKLTQEIEYFDKTTKSNLEKEIKNLENSYELKNDKEKLTKTEKEIIALKDRLTDIKSEYERASEDKTNISREIAEKQQRIEEIEKRLETLHPKAEDAEKDDSSSEKTEMDDGDEIHFELEDLVSDFEEWDSPREEEDSSEEATSENQKEIDDLNRELEKLKLGNQVLKADLENAKNILRDNPIEFQNTKNQIQESKKHKKTIEVRIQKTEENIKEKKNQLAIMKLENQQKKTDRKTKRKELGKEKSKLKKAEKLLTNNQKWKDDALNDFDKKIAKTHATIQKRKAWLDLEKVNPKKYDELIEDMEASEEAERGRLLFAHEANPTTIEAMFEKNKSKIQERLHFRDEDIENIDTFLNNPYFQPNTLIDFRNWRRNPAMVILVYDLITKINDTNITNIYGLLSAKSCYEDGSYPTLIEGEEIEIGNSFNRNIYLEDEKKRFEVVGKIRGMENALQHHIQNEIGGVAFDYNQIEYLHHSAIPLEIKLKNINYWRREAKNSSHYRYKDVFQKMMDEVEGYVKDLASIRENHKPEDVLENLEIALAQARIAKRENIRNAEGKISAKELNYNPQFSQFNDEAIKIGKRAAKMKLEAIDTTKLREENDNLIQAKVDSQGLSKTTERSKRVWDSSKKLAKSGFHKLAEKTKPKEEGVSRKKWVAKTSWKRGKMLFNHLRKVGRGSNSHH